MARERWQDKVEVRAARAHYLNVRMHADICADVQATCEETEGVDAETLQTARNNALFAEAKAHEALDALCEAVAACVDASPSETTGESGPVVRVEYDEADGEYKMRFGAAPPAGDGVPMVTEDEHGVLTMDVEGWTTHDSRVRLYYHGKTLDMLEVVLPESTYREPKGGPERRATVRLDDLRNALEALAVSYCAKRQGEG